MQVTKSIIINKSNMIEEEFKSLVSKEAKNNFLAPPDPKMMLKLPNIRRLRFMKGYKDYDSPNLLNHLS